MSRAGRGAASHVFLGPTLAANLYRVIHMALMVGNRGRAGTWACASACGSVNG